MVLFAIVSDETDVLSEPSCSYGDPRMSAASTEAYSGVDNLEIMEEALNYNAFLRDLVISRVRPNDVIVDFGAGTGVLARPLAAAGYRVSCIERDPNLRARLADAGLTVHAMLEEIPAGSLDFIYTVNVLEHIRDDGAILAALRDCLKPGGSLLVYVPAFPLLYSSMDRRVGHLRRYRRGQLVSVLRRAGLRVEFVAHQDCLGFFATLLFKLIGDDTGRINRRALVAYDRYIFPLSRRLDRWVGRWFGKNLLVVGRQDC
jgi:SAM-dependent methyltransferase